MHFYTHNIGEFAAKTRFMSPEEIGIYVILKDEYLASGMRLACDRIANLMPPECEESLRKVLKRFFAEKDGFYVCDSFEQELAAFKEKGATNSENAKKRWARRRSESEQQQSACDSDAAECDSHATRTTSHATECLTNNHKPETNNQEREGSAKARPARKKPATACPFEAGNRIPADYQETADKAGIADAQAVFSKFIDHALATGRRLADWKAGFRMWCANEAAYHPQAGRQTAAQSKAVVQGAMRIIEERERAREAGLF